MEKYQVIGLMSGTSLDGIDMVACDFYFDGTNWNYQILAAETIHYTTEWTNRLKGVMAASALEYVFTHVALGDLFGRHLKRFIETNKLSPLLIASHGHTVFHQPEKGVTAQIGDGARIAALTGVNTINDFRSKDVALGGQGAPLVPAGEAKLFSGYRFCMNLGGIANITLNEAHHRIAFDICPVNMALNLLAEKKGMPYDKDGLLASTGVIDQKLLQRLNALPYYELPSPKSLGREWFDTVFLPLLNDSKAGVEDQLATVSEHAGQQIGNSLRMLNSKSDDKLFVTGGGVFHPAVMTAINKHAAVDVIVPDAVTVSFKEAIIFAFLGLLNLKGEINVLASVTGASKDHIGGAMHKG